MKENAHFSPEQTEPKQYVHTISEEIRTNLPQLVISCIDRHIRSLALPGESRFYFIERSRINPDLFRRVFGTLLEKGVTKADISAALPSENQLPWPKYEF